MYVGCIIPTHGLADKLERCLDSLMGQETKHSIMPVIVDNATEDWSIFHLLERYYEPDQFIYVRLPWNASFARSSNTGIHVCGQVDAYLFLNNDCYMSPTCLDRMVTALKSSKGDIIGAKLDYPDGTIQHAGGIIVREWEGVHHIYRTMPSDTPEALRSRRMAFVTGACMLIRAAKFVSMGGFLEIFENGFEDVDLCLRVKKAGGNVYYCAEATGIHEESQTPGRKNPAREAKNASIFFHRWTREKVSLYQEIQ